MAFLNVNLPVGKLFMPYYHAHKITTTQLEMAYYEQLNTFRNNTLCPE